MGVPRTQAHMCLGSLAHGRQIGPDARLLKSAQIKKLNEQQQGQKNTELKNAQIGKFK